MSKTSLSNIAMILFTAFLMVSSGCKNDENIVSTQSPISDTEVANLLAASLGGSAATNGLSAQLDEAVSVAGGGGLGNRAANGKVLIPDFDTTIVKSDTIGNFSYSYTVQYRLSFSNLGNKLNFFYAMRGFYDTPRVSSDDSAMASLVVTHIVDADTQYTINETYNRLGSQTSKIGNRLQFTSNISISLTEIKVSKATRLIQSGSGTITVFGRLSDGRSFFFSANVTFLGNQQATLIINGKQFNVNLITGLASAME